MIAIHLKLVTMAAFWASSYPLGRYLAQYDAPAAIVFFRLLIACVPLCFIAYSRGQLTVRLSARQVGLFLVLGFSGFCVHNYLMFKARQYTRANTGAVINGAIPIMVVLLDFLCFKRKLSRFGLVGVAFAFFGTVIVVTHGDLRRALAGGIGFGESLFIVAISGWAVYSIAARPLLAALPPAVVTAYACLAGLLLLAPGTLVNISAALPLLSEPKIVAILVVQALLSITLGFLWYYEGVNAIGPLNAAVYANLVPVFAVILSAITIRELPDAPQLIGGALVIGGLVIVSRSQVAIPALKDSRRASG